MNTFEKIKAKKSLGQNFLIDIDTLCSIADFFDIKNKNIVEVGPGYGALTEYLLQKNPKKLSLIELDHDMVKILHTRIQQNELNVGETDFQIYQQDILTYSPDFLGEEYLVIANIPYYITSPILRHFLYEVEKKPSNMLILMQKEVGERILEGQIGNKKGIIKSSVLSLMVAKRANVEKVVDVPARFFKPAPKVDSLVIAFEILEQYAEVEDSIFMEFIKKAFSEPRKKLSSNLKKAGYDDKKIVLFFQENGINENARPEDLGLEEYLKMLSVLHKN